MKKIIAEMKIYFQKHPKWGEAILLTTVFIVSFFVRRIGVKHGFPLLTHPDEITIIQPVLDMTRLHTLNPGNFNRPDQILDYLNLIYLNIVSFLKFGENVYWAFEDHYLDFYFHSRLLISVMGSLIPIVAYKIGKEIKPKIALPAALVFASFPLYIEHSLYITPDIPITLFTLLVIYFAVRYLNTKKQIFIILATVFAAINTAEKYPGLLSLSIVIVALGIEVFYNNETTHREKFPRFLVQFLLVALIFIISLFIVAPFLFIEYQSVIQALITESRSTHLGADSLGWLGNMWFYIKSFYANVNILGIFLITLGIVTFIKNFDKKNILVLYSIFYWVALSKLALHWERWALPMYIAPLFLIAFGINTLWNQRKRHLAVLIGSIVLALSFLVPQGIHAVYIPVRMKFTDTRLVSQYYCQENNITQENSLFEGLTPLRPKYSKSIFQEYIELVPHVDYIILSSFMGDRYSAEPERYADEINIYHNIRTENVLIKMFNPYPYTVNPCDQLENIIYFVNLRMGRTTEVRYKGPIIEIYKVP